MLNISGPVAQLDSAADVKAEPPMQAEVSCRSGVQVPAGPPPTERILYHDLGTGMKINKGIKFLD